MTKLIFSVLASAALLVGCQADADVTPSAEGVAESVETADVTADPTEVDATKDVPVDETSEVASAAEKTTDMEVAVFRDGGVEIDGERLELDAAISTINAASGAETMVYYYREAPQEEPHPNAMVLIRTVMEAGLGLAFSSEPDFSTIVVPDTGEILPRS